MKYSKTTLKNGIRIITAPLQGTQTVTVMILAGVGSRHETEKEAGLSHFIEHMLFKGTEKRPTSLSISETLDSVGGEFNAFTSKDKTAYYAKVDSKHLMLALDVISDIFLNSKFDEEEIKKEAGTIIQELQMYEDRPSRKVWDEFDGLIFKNNPLGREILGYEKTIKSFKKKDFHRYMSEKYSGDNTVICVAGKFDEKKVISFIEKTFSSKTRSSKKIEYKKIVDNQKKPQFKIKYKKTDQTHLVIGCRGYDENHPDRFVLSLISTILGGNMSSRLFTEIREKRGLAYSVRTSVDAYQDCGYIATQVGIAHNKLKETIAVILDEYEKIKNQQVSEKELQNAKDYIKGKFIMEFEASDEVALFFGDQETSRKKIVSLEEIFEKIEKVTAKDIIRVAKDIFQERKLNFAMVGPHKNEKEIGKLLKFKL